MALLQLSSALVRAQRQAGFTRLGALAIRGFTTMDPDTHDDFKPKYKGAKNDVNSQIEEQIKGHDVFIYMKGTPNQPMCGFSNKAILILEAYGVKYGSCNVLADPNIREGIKAFSNWPTIPQVYVKGEFIGGADILYNMHEDGELEKLLEPIIAEQEKNAPQKQCLHTKCTH